MFGSSVSLHGDVAVRSADGDDDACPTDPSCNSGAVSVFRDQGSSWTEETSSSPWMPQAVTTSVSQYVPTTVRSWLAPAMRHGHRADLEQRTSTTTTDRPGSRRRSSSRPTVKMETLLGRSVAMSAGAAWVGAQGDGDVGRDAGATYVFSTLPDVNLAITPQVVLAGDAISFDVSYGVLGDPLLLTVVVPSTACQHSVSSRQELRV